MASLNEVYIMGYLGKDPALEYSQANPSLAFCRINVATTTINRQGEKKTEWHNFTCFDRRAKAICKCLHKGSLVLIKGALRTRKWKTGNGENRAMDFVHVTNIQFLDRRPRAAAKQGNAERRNEESCGADDYGDEYLDPAWSAPGYSYPD